MRFFHNFDGVLPKIEGLFKNLIKIDEVLPKTSKY
jgi:hypothetical protein